MPAHLNKGASAPFLAHSFNRMLRLQLRSLSSASTQIKRNSYSSFPCRPAHRTARVRLRRTRLYSAAWRSLAASRSRPSVEDEGGRLRLAVTSPRAPNVADHLRRQRSDAQRGNQPHLDVTLVSAHLTRDPQLASVAEVRCAASAAHDN